MTAIPSLPVRGRDEQMQVLGDVIAEAEAGRGSVTVIEGGPGMGKTRLLQAAWIRAAELTFRMGRGMADPSGRVVELAPLLEALFDHEPPLLDRNALTGVHASPEQRFWLLQEFQNLLEDVALEAPVLIVLDDLHWADAGTAEALRLLPRRLCEAPIAWVIALRPGQGSAAVQSMVAALADEGAHRLQLSPLAPHAVASIARDLLAAEPDAALLRHLDSVNGNPFLLVDFIRGLEAEGIVSTSGGRAVLSEDRLPSRVSDDMRIRLARLPDTAERLATTAASLGRRFTVADLAAMSELSVPDLVAPIRILSDADILADSDDRLSFVHDLVRDAVRASVPTALRKALDRRGADVLLARGAMPVEVAAQLAASAEAGDDIAIATLGQAADALASTDPAAAAELAERALALMPDQHELRGPLVARRAITLFAAGMGDRAKDYADNVLHRSLTAEQQARVRLSIATMFVLSPDLRAENARQGLSLPRLPIELRANLRAAELHNLVVGGRTAEADQIVIDVEAEAQASGGRDELFAVDLAVAGLGYQHFTFIESLARLDAGLELGTAEDIRARLACYYRGWLLTALDRFDEAQACADDGVAAARRDRQNWAAYIFETWKGHIHLQTGRLPDAAAALEGRVRAGDGLTVGGIIDAANVSALARIRIHTSDEWGARETVHMCERLMASTAPAVRRHAAWALAAHAMAHGRPEDAHTWLSKLSTAEDKSPIPLYPHDVAIDPELVRIGLAVGDEDLVAGTVTVAEERFRLNPGVRSIAGCALHVRGLATRSAETIGSAVPLIRAAQRPLALSSALEDLGRLLVDSGSTKQGVAALDEALDVAVTAGATRDAARLRGRLRELGIRRRIVASADQRNGWAALTPAEHQVASLVADGRTNREISEQLLVSTHTVNTHLRHIFEKLGIRSRVELARLAGQPDAE